MNWNARAARQRSLEMAAELDYPAIPTHLPLIDRVTTRSVDEIIDRALVLNVIINCSYGMPTGQGRAWLAANEVAAGLTQAEHRYLSVVEDGDEPSEQGHQLQVERLWCLAWALQLTDMLSWSDYCGQSLASLFPNLRIDESANAFRSLARSRPAPELLDELDLAYCLSWAHADANLRQASQVGPLRQYVVWERRSALEWLAEGDWDNPDLST